MPSEAIAQVRLHRDGALPEDDVVNVWHFRATNPTGTFGDFAPGLLDRLTEFYTAIQDVLGSTLSGECETRLYNWQDEEPRVPHSTREFTITPGSGSFPAEIAVCLSFEAAVSSGQRKGRRRGRVFLGPISAGVSAYPSGSSDIILPEVYRTAICTAAEALVAGTTDGSFEHHVYSPTEFAQTSDTGQAWNRVVRYWVDDAFDIQRRRGAAPKARTQVLVPET